VFSCLPRGEDTQTPHSQDEVYVVVSGHGQFRSGDEMVDFTTGDALFVPAKVVHRFENFSDDLSTWVIFFGPRKS
jgi:mannose-6-phosphate isomerase-like protein (cupin superfamily)